MKLTVTDMFSLNRTPFMQTLPATAVIREVGLRDGLQSIQTILPTAQKIEWLTKAYGAGQRLIEVCSFAPPQINAATGRYVGSPGVCQNTTWVIGLSAGA
jgi:hypothetical protein